MAFFKTYKKYIMTSGIIWAACLVLSVLIYFLVLGPQNRTRKRIKSELEDKKQKYEFAQNSAKEETKIRLYKQIEDLHNKLDFFVIDFEDSANLSFDISQIASDKKVASPRSSVAFVWAPPIRAGELIVTVTPGSGESLSSSVLTINRPVVV